MPYVGAHSVFHVPGEKPLIPTGFGKKGLVGVVSSGLGFSMAAFFTNPIEVAKVRVQMAGPGQSVGFARTLLDIYSAEGLAAVQAGLGVSALRELAKCSLRIGLVLPVLARVHDREQYGPPPLSTTLLVSGGCGAFSALVCNPLDLAKTRVQNQPESLAGTLRGLVKEGGLGSLWRGVGVSMCRSTVSTAAVVPVKITIQDQLAARGLHPDTPGRALLCSILASVPAALSGVLAMQPFDTVRTRLYNQKAGSTGRPQYASALDCARGLVAEGGLPALWRGTTAHFTRYGPHCVLGFVFIDQIVRIARRTKQERLSAQWRRDMRVEFDRADANRDGSLSISEVSAAFFAAAGLPRPSAGQLEALTEKIKAQFRLSDRNSDGRVSFEEFEGLAQSLNTLAFNLSLDRAFERADKDKDGLVSSDELLTLLADLAPPGDVPVVNELSLEQCKAGVQSWVTRADQDGNGALDSREFKLLVDMLRDGEASNLDRVLMLRLMNSTSIACE